MVEHLFMIFEIIVVYLKVNNHQMTKMEAWVQSWEDCSTAYRAKKKRSILLQRQGEGMGVVLTSRSIFL